MPHSRHLVDLAAPTLTRQLRPDSVLLLPVGSIEQHGPHLPVSTDLLIAEQLAEAVVAERGAELDLWLLPSLAYTKSNEHAWSPGTIWLRPQTLLAVLDDLGRSLAATGVTRLAFLNGHGGNTALLQVALRELRLAYGLRTFLLHPAVPPDAGGSSPAGELGMGVHAGTDETSIVLHLRPDLVDLSLAERNVPEHLAANRYVRFGGQVAFGWVSDDFGPSGVIGDPTTATAARGEQLWRQMLTTAGEALAEVATFSP